MKVLWRSKDDNGNYVFDLRSYEAQNRLTDPRHIRADFYSFRIRVLITYHLADLSHD
jgi:hypothetical protein